MIRFLYVSIFLGCFQAIGQAQSIASLLEVISSDTSKAFPAYEKLIQKAPRVVEDFFSKSENISLFNEVEYLEYIDPQKDVLAISQFVAYCKQKAFPYQSLVVRKDLMKLKGEMTEYERFFREKHLLKKLTYQDIACLEFYGFLYGTFQDDRFDISGFDVSLNKLLDILYEKYWINIVESERLLRFYVYKCLAFTKYKDSEGYNKYYRRFKGQPMEVRDKLMALYRKEQNIQMKQALLIAIYTLETSLPASQKLKLRMPLEQYLQLGKQAIVFSERIVEVREKDLPYLFDQIKKTTQKDKLHLLFSLIDLHKLLGATPYLINLLNDEKTYSVNYVFARYARGGCRRIERRVTVGQRAIKSLNTMFNQVFIQRNLHQLFVINAGFELKGKNSVEQQKNYWQSYWERHQQEVEQWKNRFFKERIQYLQQQKILRCDVIFKLLENKKLTKVQRQLILSQTVRVSDISCLRYIDFQEGDFLPKEILEMCQSVSLHYRDYAILVDQVSRDDKEYLLIHFLTKLESYKIKEQGEILRYLLYFDWFKALLLENKQDVRLIELFTQRFKQVYPSYTGKSEDNTLFFLETFYNNINQKIAHLKQYDLANHWEVMQSFCQALRWEEQSQFLQKWAALKMKKQIQQTIINEYFGIALSKIEDKTISTLIRDMKQMNEYALKCKYLKQVEMPVQRKDGKLDYNLIYKYLHYYFAEDGFVTTGNGVSRGIIEPVIHLLKKEFKSTQESVAYWVDFLMQKKLINVRFKTAFLGNFQLKNTLFD